MGKNDVPLAPLAALSYAESKGEGREPSRLSMFTMFPLLTLSLLVYGIMAMALGGAAWTNEAVFTVSMISGDDWVVSGGDLFLMFSLFLLFIEILRATKTGTDSILNHAFSAVLFVACFACFLIVPNFGSSTFFLVTLMTFMDFMAGFIVTTLAARRDFGVSPGIGA